MVEWFSVAVNGDESDDENVRRKKRCPTCRAQISTPPLALWSLNGLLQKLPGARPQAELDEHTWDGE